MAEIVLGAFLNVLFEKLASAGLIKLAQSEGIYSQLSKWKSTLHQIKALLVDAGNKHITDGAVALWLHELQDLAYDIDDVLDDLATEAIRRKFNQESYATSSTNKVFKFIPTCCTNFTPHNIKYGHTIGCKLDEITTKLHHLAEQKNTLGLNVSMNVERSNRTVKRLEETSLVDESKVMGREGDKEALLEMLLGNEACNQNVSVVSIVGLGGIGKTTLAKVLYNEEKVNNHFELKAWVCVSEKFDVFNISKAIFQAVAGMNQEFANLDLLHVALKEKLSNKRFLVVLDDVWNEDYKEWELLQSPFTVGAPGSKVIVTTRKTKVASAMNSFQPYDLKVLSEEKALSLFAQCALDEPNFDKHPTLELCGESIVKKCGRLPLALITLGRVLRTKATGDEWEEVLNSEIWNIEDGNQILPALRLSYYDLPSHLKQLFAYCSLFPKDYVFDKIELVLLWMAEGFLNQSNGKKSKESLGRDYFEELKSRSFFQTLTDDQSCYIMHDLINDLATIVAGEFFLRLDDKIDANDEKEYLEKFRHVSFIGEGYEAYRKFNELQRARGLRTFLHVSLDPWASFSLSNNILTELLPQLQFLRVLNLSNHTITEVPQSIGSLKHIRYLNFSKTSIERLPEQVCDLYHLQSLLLRDCEKLSSLPVSFVKLINLGHLDISNTPMLNKMPLGIGGLKGLQTLSKVIIEEGNGFKISELKGLSDLKGRLSIVGLDKVTNPNQANNAKLLEKKGLNDLVMDWSNDFDDSRNHMVEYKVLKELKPHQKLRNLEILFYGGMEFPSWVGNPSFDQLTNLTLRGCRCKHLPTLGHLGSLQKLFVERMNEVRTIGFELLAPTNSFSGVAFPKLQVLKLHEMQGWEIWSHGSGSGDRVGTAESFPCLHKISIKSCPKLGQVSIGLIPSLGVLHIGRCSEEVFRSMVGVSSSIKTLKMENIRGLAQLNGEVLEHLGAVEYLRIKKCAELRYLWESESEACKFLVSLRKLAVHGCEKLESLGGTEVNLGISMESVKDVSLHDCRILQNYSCPKSIERLEIKGCSSITSLTFPMVDDLPSTLRFLAISSCGNLEESLLQNNLLPSLESLSIDRFDNLRSLPFPPEGCFVHLTTLKIWNCGNIESIPGKGFGFLPMFCLKTLEICCCRNLKLFPHEHLESLTSLGELLILCCPKMDYSFPSGSWPPNLRILSIGHLKKPMSEWGLQNYPISLAELNLYGKQSRVVSFAVTEEHLSNSCFLLPQSLISLSLFDFEDLESDSDILQHIPGLQCIWTGSCPKLTDWPTTTMTNGIQSIGAALFWKRIQSRETHEQLKQMVESLDSILSVHLSRSG